MCNHHLNTAKLWEVKERKTRIVVLISFVTMALEITFGYLTNSMALLSDGWHMSSHVIAIGAGWLTYKYVIQKQNKNMLTNNPDRIFSLTGYTNGLVLLAIAVLMFLESLQRLNNPILVNYSEAIVVSLIGLIVNIISAKVLHINKNDRDNNLKATYIHVISDVLTSVLALVALFAGLYFHIYWLDSIMGIFGSIVITIWAWGIIKNSWKDLVKNNSLDKLKLRKINTA